jgi:hypothetical protein
MPSGAGAPNSIVSTYPSGPGVRSARVTRNGERWARTKASIRRAVAAIAFGVAEQPDRGERGGELGGAGEGQRPEPAEGKASLGCLAEAERLPGGGQQLSGTSGQPGG